MAKTSYWADAYLTKRKSVKDAISAIKSGQRIFVGSGASEPQFLVQELKAQAKRLMDIEIIQLFGLDSSVLSTIHEDNDGVFDICLIYSGSGKAKSLRDKIRYITPVNLFSIPGLFRSKSVPLNVALLQTTPPDDFGFLSLGVSVDISLEAALSADYVIAQINSNMPRVFGRSFIHVNDVDVLVEHDEPLIEVEAPKDFEAANIIAKIVEPHIEDGSTIHMPPGITEGFYFYALSNKNDIGFHSEFITDHTMRLFSTGVITNRKKSIKKDRIIASSAIGSQALYEFLDDNPVVSMHPSDYVSKPDIISQNDKMVSINLGRKIDLTGQISTDGFTYNNFMGMTGILDFVRGSIMSNGGKSIIILLASDINATRSHIIPMLDKTAVVIPRSDVHYVATEYGIVNLFGKNIQERALSLISIAHPNFRDELLEQAKELGYVEKKRNVKRSLQGIYPVHLEDKLTLKNEIITIRPVTPSDERKVQEHYYNLERNDVVSRFFYDKRTFLKEDINYTVNIDYIKNLTLIATTGVFGFDKIIAVGEYLYNKNTDMAEIAFSVHKEWQGKGLSKIMLKKLAKEAKKNKFKGLLAYTSISNENMIKLFKTLPYTIKTEYEDDMVILTCNFD